MLNVDVSQMLEHVGETQQVEMPYEIKLAEDDFKVISPVELKLTLLSTGNSILVQGTIGGTLELICSRCLEPFQQRFKVAVEEEYKKPQVYHEFSGNQLDENELHYYTNLPEEPRPYRSILETVATVPYYADLLSDAQSEIGSSCDPEVELIDGEWTISYSLGELVPKKEIRNLEPFIIWAGDAEVGDEWAILARAYATELGDPQTIDLAIRFISPS